MEQNPNKANSQAAADARTGMRIAWFIRKATVQGAQDKYTGGGGRRLNNDGSIVLYTNYPQNNTTPVTTPVSYAVTTSEDDVNDALLEAL